MRIAQVENKGARHVVLENEGRYYPWSEVMGGPPPDSVVDVLSVLCGSQPRPVFTGARALDGPCRLLAPFEPPRNVICIGKNYADHADEFSSFVGQEVVREAEPVVFTKSPSAICDPYAEVTVHEAHSALLDYEVELAVVIGVAGHRIAAARALDHVAGYSVINDITDRVTQLRQPQWFLAKSLHRASAFGPVLVTPDELPVDPRLTTEIDGEVRQDARVSQMMCGVPGLLEFVSQYIELRPGDVIATGTPSGVGVGFTPARCIADGMTVTCAIEGIGRLENRFRLASDNGAPRLTQAVAAVDGEPAQ